MDISQYVDRLREDLGSAAAAGDEQTRRTAAAADPRSSRSRSTYWLMSMTPL